MMTTEQDFARGMRSLRNAFELSQDQLADRLAAYGVVVDSSAVSRMENARGNAPRAIRLNEAAAVSAIFGWTVEQICAIGSGATTRPMAATLRRLADEIDGGVA